MVALRLVRPGAVSINMTTVVSALDVLTSQGDKKEDQILPQELSQNTIAFNTQGDDHRPEARRSVTDERVNSANAQLKADSSVNQRQRPRGMATQVQPQAETDESRTVTEQVATCADRPGTVTALVAAVGGAIWGTLAVRGV